MIKKKRKVSRNLGRTQHKDADINYEQIRKKIGDYKKCPFYKGKKVTPPGKSCHSEINPKFDFQKVPIEEFDFQKNKDGTWGLQSYCKECYKVYRQMRIKNSRSIYENMSLEQIHEYYLKNVGDTMMCSKCREDLPPVNFRASPGMEKGLHNICYECEGGSGDSVREKEWLSDGDWNSWRIAVSNMRQNKEVQCAGWKPSVDLGYCLGIQDGKKMHADHIVPLRAGGIHDAKNFQPLCETCNSKKSSQLDIEISIDTIRELSSPRYHPVISEKDSIGTVERKMKQGLVDYISGLYIAGKYKDELKNKKKEVNGQWGIERFYKKGVDWIKRQVEID